ncbi:MAG: PAS domain S-box protein [Thermoanaerobaculia bacterium]|nr:PAS domain S-box protein [Thermoanaerobaculia bacterium]
MDTTSGSAVVTTTTAGQRAGLVGVLRRDPFLISSLVLAAVISALYLWPIDAYHRSRLSTIYAPAALGGLALAALAKGLGKLHDREERRFWSELLAGFGCLLLVPTLYLVFDKEAGLFPGLVNVSLLADGIYGLYYLGWILAGECRPDQRYRFRPTALEHNLVWPSVSTFVAGLLGYFWLAPLLLDREHYRSWLPSMQLYLVIDTYLVARFFYLYRNTHDRRWRKLYGLLTLALLAFLLSDSIEASFYVSGAGASWGKVQDVLWVLPYVISIAAVRLRHFAFPYEPEPDATELRHWQSLPSPSGRTLIFALTFPALHFVLQTLSAPISPLLTEVREVVVLVSMVLLGSIAYLQHRLLERRAHELWLERLRIEKALRKSEDTLRLSLERSQAEKAIHASEEKFFKIFHSSPAAMGIATIEDGRIVDVNRGYEQLTGYTRREIVGRTVGDLQLWWHPEQRAAMVRMLTEKGSIGDLQVVMRTKTGAKRIVWFAVESLEIDGESCLLSVAHDVTDRQEVGEKIERKAALLDHAAAAVYALDLRDRITFWSSGAERLFGWSAVEAMGKKAHELLAFEPPEAAEETRAAAGEALTKDGRRIVVDIRSIPVLGHNGELRSRLVLGAERTEPAPVAIPTPTN